MKGLIIMWVFFFFVIFYLRNYLYVCIMTIYIKKKTHTFMLKIIMLKNKINLLIWKYKKYSGNSIDELKFKLIVLLKNERNLALNHITCKQFMFWSLIEFYLYHTFFFFIRLNKKTRLISILIRKTKKFKSE